MFKLDLKKAQETEVKLPTSAGSSKKQASSRKTSISALLTMPKHLTGWIAINWKILEEVGIPDHLTCLLRNLYAGQEATIRTGHGTTDWFQIGKGVRQGCIVSPCIFNLYAGGSMIAQLVKNLPAMQETQLNSWVRKIGWRRERLPTTAFWLREYGVTVGHVQF